MSHLYKKVGEASDESKMPKLRQDCAKVEVDDRYKVTSGRVQTFPTANNQAQVCVLQCNFWFRHQLC